MFKVEKKAKRKRNATLKLAGSQLIVFVCLSYSSIRSFIHPLMQLNLHKYSEQKLSNICNSIGISKWIDDNLVTAPLCPAPSKTDFVLNSFVKYDALNVGPIRWHKCDYVITYIILAF